MDVHQLPDISEGAIFLDNFDDHNLRYESQLRAKSKTKKIFCYFCEREFGHKSPPSQSQSMKIRSAKTRELKREKRCFVNENMR